MNTFKSTLLLVTLTLFFLFIGDRVGGQNGMLLALLLSVAFNFGSYFYSDKLALAMYRAQPVTRAELPRAYEVVERLTAKQGIPMPKMYILPTESPNAFATGRNPQHASVAVTHGILQLLDDEELEGVLAHELGHVKNRDILTSSIAATLAGAITMVARMGYFASLFGGDAGGRDSRERGGSGGLFMIILAPIAASLIQLAVSRSREYEADATGATLTGNPYALARALQKLDNYSRRIPMAASPSTAHLFIVAPLLGVGGIGNLFSTHPPIKDRIVRLIGRDHVYMTTLLRSIRLLSIVVWEGGLLFFAFVLAPVAFHVLPSNHQAGLVVGGTLVILHSIGMVCGALFLIATAILWNNRRIHRRRLYAIQLILVAAMLAITAYLQFDVVPAMERDRIQAGGNVDAAPPNDPARLDFERLHPRSEQFEGAALFAGLGIVLLMAAESPTPKTIDL